MENSDTSFSEIVGLVKSWMPRRSEPVSRVFWMPDHSCRVCYECDMQFTILNRRHHCRLCGRVFCGKCTANSVAVTSNGPNNVREEEERIRVCNFCFKQWDEIAAADNRILKSRPRQSPSLSTTSLASTKSSSTISSSAMNIGSRSHSTGPCQRAPYGSDPNIHHPAQLETCLETQNMMGSGRTMGSITDVRDQDGTPNQYRFFLNRSDDEDEYEICHSDSETRFQDSNGYYSQGEYDDGDQGYQSNKMQPAEEDPNSREFCSPMNNNTDFHVPLDDDKIVEEAGFDHNYECDASSIYGMEGTDAEPVDFENNGLLWLPPDPEYEEDETECNLFDDDDENVAGEWGCLRSSNSFGSGEYRSRDRSTEGQKKAMKNVVDGHFRSLIAQLLQVENLPIGEEDDSTSWLEIITSLSLEAATLLKPDTSKGAGMDPGGYVKIKCLACGHRSQSMVVKGVVCRKNIAHRHMKSRIEKPSFLILGGALEYQRVTNLLSSFDTLLQQEMDHLKMAVAKIDVHHPNVLLVEKSVSRFAQEYLLAKNISLVLNVKRPVLDRIARCTDAQIVPSIDHLSSQKLGHSDLFRVEKFLEEHGSAGQGGKKMKKTLMFFEGCPQPFGVTILLMGSSGDELKKVKHVVQYGVFAAYHLAVETSFLADEGASLPEPPLKSPVTVGLLDKQSNTDRSISTVPDLLATVSEKTQLPSDVRLLNTSDPTILASISSGRIEMDASSHPAESCNSQIGQFTPKNISPSVVSTRFPVEKNNQVLCTSYSSHCAIKEKNKVCFGEHPEANTLKNDYQAMTHDPVVPLSCLNSLDPLETGVVAANGTQVENDKATSQNNDQRHELRLSKEEFTPSDHQSILVSLSTRCVWKGTVCERSHLFRIKYYGNLDKPLGRFLRDHLFDQSYRCRSCDMPSEAHVHCYTHRQGSLTISVRKLPEFLLPGEVDGKIWMWHRCLRCPQSNGLPPSTQRIVMSDAAWGLSFGKFLELSFSNHAAANRVASCGHSLHRDCLRFYGLGKMVACFRYASVNLYSVCLPTPDIDFNYQNQEWIQKEGNEVSDRAELLFTEIQNALLRIKERISNSGSCNSDMNGPNLRHDIVELEGLLQKEKAEFEESLQKILKKEMRKEQPVIDILEVNKLRRQLLFQSYLWDQRLIFAAGSGNSRHEVFSSFLTRDKEKLAEMNLAAKPARSFTSSDAVPSDTLSDESLRGITHVLNHQEELHDHPYISNGQQRRDIELDLFQVKQSKTSLSTSTSATDQLLPKETCLVGRRALSDGQFPIMANLSATFDAKWTGENSPSLADASMSDSSASVEAAVPVPVEAAAAVPVEAAAAVAVLVPDDPEERSGVEVTQSLASTLLTKLGDSAEDFSSWIGIPFLNFYRSLNKNWISASRFDKYSPVYVFLFRELERQNGARLLLPVCINDTVIPIYDDEPTSIISYALASHDYHSQMLDERERIKGFGDPSFSSSSYDSGNFHLFQSAEEIPSEHFRSFGSTDDNNLSLSGSRSSLVSDPLFLTKTMHVRVSFTDEDPLGKVKYTVTCYYAKHFDALRRICCPSELDFIRSLSRCKKWGAQGGKSNVFFAKSLDDRFIVKQVTKTEIESFIKFAPEYFKYLSGSISTGSPTCLAKILGIYQVMSKHLKGGKVSRMDVLVMENLLFGRNVTRLYDLKGSLRSRYNPDSSGNDKVLLDQNLIEALPTSPIFVGNKAKRLLERSVWNDTAFLASADVMDYSLLVGLNEEKHELVLGIIDFMRQYTWDKHLETWVKASGILGGPKNASPTVVSPKQYKKRFRKAMSAYFLVVPDHWSHPTIVPSKLQADFCEDNQQEPYVES